MSLVHRTYISGFSVRCKLQRSHLNESRLRELAFLFKEDAKHSQRHV